MSIKDTLYGFKSALGFLWALTTIAWFCAEDRKGFFAVWLGVSLFWAVTLLSYKYCDGPKDSPWFSESENVK